jgi:hypothetical protein
MMWAVFTFRRNSLGCQVGRYESFTPSHHGLTVERRDTSTPLGVDEDDGRDAAVSARGGPNDDDDDECRPTTAGLRSRAASCRSSSASSSSRAPSTWILASCAAPPALHRSIDVFPWLCSYTVVAWWMPSWTGTGTSFPGAATLADRRCIGGVLEVYRRCIGRMYWRCIGGVLEVYWRCIGGVLEVYWLDRWAGVQRDHAAPTKISTTRMVSSGWASAVHLRHCTRRMGGCQDLGTSDQVRVQSKVKGKR